MMNLKNRFNKVTTASVGFVRITYGIASFCIQ